MCDEGRISYQLRLRMARSDLKLSTLPLTRVQCAMTKTIWEENLSNEYLGKKKNASFEVCFGKIHECLQRQNGR